MLTVRKSPHLVPSPKLMNNVVWVVVPLILLVISTLMKRCSNKDPDNTDDESNMSDISNPMDRYCVMFGRPPTTPSIHTLLKSCMKSVFGGVVIYLYVLASGLLNAKSTSLAPLTTLKYIVGVIVLHDYLSTLFDTIVGLDVMYFSYEMYYVGLFVVCWLLFNI